MHRFTKPSSRRSESKYRPYWQADMELEMKRMHNLMPRLLDVYGAMLFFVPQHLSTVSFRLHQMKWCDTLLSAAAVSWWYHQKQRHDGSHAIIPKLMRWPLNAYDASVNSDARDVRYCTSLSQTATVRKRRLKQRNWLLIFAVRLWQRRRLAVCKRRLDLSIQNDLYALSPYGRCLVQLS